MHAHNLLADGEPQSRAAGARPGFAALDELVEDGFDFGFRNTDSCKLRGIEVVCALQLLDAAGCQQQLAQHHRGEPA